MICTDCQKSYEGSGIRCPYCAVKHDLANKSSSDKQLYDAGPVSVKEAKRCRFILYLAAAFSFLMLALASTAWYLIYSKSVVVNSPLLIAIRDHVQPSGLLIQAIIFFGVLFKSRAACFLQIIGFSFYLLLFQKIMGNQVFHPATLVIGVIYLVTLHYCFEWHRLRKKVLGN